MLSTPSTNEKTYTEMTSAVFMIHPRQLHVDTWPMRIDRRLRQQQKSTTDHLNLHFLHFSLYFFLLVHFFFLFLVSILIHIMFLAVLDGWEYLNNKFTARLSSDTQHEAFFTSSIDTYNLPILQQNESLCYRIQSK